MPFWATFKASSISASETSSEPPSTITIESAEPLTTRSMLENSSCWKVGLRIQLPSTRPTRTAASGPFQGTVERPSAVAAATTPRTSASFSWSADSTVTKTCTSFLNPSGNSGRMDRSIRPAGQDLLVGGPAFALEEPARNLAGGVGLFPVLDGEREERKGGDVGGDGYCGEHHRVAETDRGGACGLAGQPARLEDQGASGELGFNPLYGHCFLSLCDGRLCCASRVQVDARPLTLKKRRGRPDYCIGTPSVDAPT